jgi:fructose-1,6-bisphosphatase II
MLGTVSMCGRIVAADRRAVAEDILPRGEPVGSGVPPEVDAVMDPLDGARLLALGRPNALSAIAVSEQGTLFDTGPATYMEKIAVGPAGASAIDITASVEKNLRALARAKRKEMEDLTVVVLDRPRHEDLVAQIRATGARIRLLSDGDVAGAMMPAFEVAGADALMGIGGAAEGVLAACALACVGGAIQARLCPQTEAERRELEEAGFDVDRVLTTKDLVASDNVFFACTGVTEGDVLHGVQYSGTGANTYSLTTRSRSGTMRFIEGRHRWDKLMKMSQVAYDHHIR